jgi:hypothetical protein
MKETPILFNTEMVCAINGKYKSQTRRTKGLERINKVPDRFMIHGIVDGSVHVTDLESLEDFSLKSPFGDIGDMLWVKETTCWVMRDHAHDLLEGANSQLVYKASIHPDWMLYAKEKYGYKWKPSLFMKKEDCRIWLKIKSISVERLQSISRKNAIAEGIEIMPGLHWWKNYLGSPLPGTSDPILSFKTLWISINGQDNWNLNPWVWVVEFERGKKVV